MALVNSYPSAVPTGFSHVLGVNFEEDGAPTKLFPLQGIIDLVEEQIPAGPQGPVGPPGPIGPAGTNGLYAQTALGTLITDTIVETSLIGTGVGSLTIPANGFSVGDSFTAKVCGALSCANNETIHIRVKSDGVTIADTGIFQMKLTTDKYFELILDFTIAAIGGPGTAKLFTNGQYSYNHNAAGEIAGNNFALVSDTVFNTTVTNVLSITAEWGSAKDANKIQSQNFVLTRVY